MFRILRIITAFFLGLIKFAISPVLVFWKGTDKVLHFYIPLVIHGIGCWLGYGGLTGIGCIVLAIFKEEIIDELLGFGTRDYYDVYWTFKAVVWVTFLYCISAGVYPWWR